MSNLIRHQILENGIHEVTFLAKNRASVDEFFQQMQLIYDTNSLEQIVRLLIDLSMAGTIPMQYMFQQSQYWRRRNPKNIRIRVVILHPTRGVLPVARVLINAVMQSRGPQATLRLESVAHREEAIEWLLQDAP